MYQNGDKEAAIATASMILMDDDEENGDANIFMAAMIACMFTSFSRLPRVRIFGYDTDIVPNYNTQEFRRKFRLSPATYLRIVDYLKECPELAVSGYGGREPISVEKQLLILLWLLGGNDTINKIADRFGVSESSVIASRNRVIDAILNNLMKRFIVWPDNLREVEESFRMRNGFPGIVGALDGTHIEIKAPLENPQRYVNRKKYHSLQLQIVCNTDMLLMDCFCGYPGSCHDSRVLSQSPLVQRGLHLENMYHIIADGGYPLKRWLLTPYRDNGRLSPEQRNFNYILSSNRVVVERAIGLLKGRFRRLQYIDSQSIEITVKTIVCACVLHNICLLTGDDIEEFMEMDVNGNNQGPICVVQENEFEGQIKRNVLARQLFRH